MFLQFTSETQSDMVSSSPKTSAGAVKRASNMAQVKDGHDSIKVEGRFCILLLTSSSAYVYIFNVGNCNEAMLIFSCLPVKKM